MSTDLGSVIARQKGLVKSRFRGRNDWLRLVLLGAIIVTFSVISIADALIVHHVPGQFNGSSAIFGGIATALFILRIARDEPYFDWLLGAVFYFLAGIAFYWDQNITFTLSIFCICSFIFACAATRIWIGLTASPKEGAGWLLSSGCVAVFGGFWVVFAWFLAMPRTIALIFAFDTLFQGIAIAGFGNSLKEDR